MDKEILRDLRGNKGIKARHKGIQPDFGSDLDLGGLQYLALFAYSKLLT